MIDSHHFTIIHKTLELESLEVSSKAVAFQEMACSVDGRTDGINHVMMCARDSDLRCSSVLRTVIRDRQGRQLASCVVTAQVMVTAEYE